MENKAPLFSIVIPTYNHGHLIKRCLDSIVAQTCTDWEAIVVNNFSEDNTVDVVESYHDERIRLVNNANNGVIAVSRNKGIELAQGAWICFLDSDDWYYPDKLAVAAEYMDDNDIIYHDLDRYTGDNLVRGKVLKGRALMGNIWDDLLINSNGIPCSSVVIRSQIIRKVGGFSEQPEMVAVEDSDCWIRVAECTLRFKYIARNLGGYWIGNNTSASVKQVDREQRLFDRHAHKLSPSQQRTAFSSLAYRQARIYHKLGMFSQARAKYRIALSLSHPQRIALYCSTFLHLIL